MKGGSDPATMESEREVIMFALIATINFNSITSDDMYGSLRVIIQSLADIKSIILHCLPTRIELFVGMCPVAELHIPHIKELTGNIMV